MLLNEGNIVEFKCSMYHSLAMGPLSPAKFS